MSLRRTSLSRKSELRRGGELKRSQLQRKTAKGTRAVRATRRDTGPSPEQRAAVKTRAGGCCERCGRPLYPWTEFSVHHRLPRGRGGQNTLSNLVLLCGSGVTGCHGQVESQREASYDTGWLIRTGADPATVPVFAYAFGHVLLTEDGDYQEVAA